MQSLLIGMGDIAHAVNVFTLCVWKEGYCGCPSHLTRWIVVILLPLTYNRSL